MSTYMNPTKPPLTDVAAFLQTLPNRQVIYCPNPGNAGDSLIAAATYQLFDEVGIRHRDVAWDEPFDATGQVLLYGGGGNLTEQYPNARHFIERHHHSAKRLIVLPHTVQGHADLLRELGANVHIFCREERSLDWVREQTAGPHVHLAPDLAFHLDHHALLGREAVAGTKAAGAMIRSLFRSTMRRYGPNWMGYDTAWGLRRAWETSSIALIALSRPQTKVLHALRVDDESPDAPVPPDNVDVSRIFEYGTQPRDVADRAARGMLSYLNRYQRVVTNRLHGCIAAALLGKSVDFYANSYFKNEAVYRFCMEDQYPNVRWHGEWTGTLPSSRKGRSPMRD